MPSKKNINRRDFISSAAAASLAFTIVPRHVVGGPGFIPPSDKLNLAYIGCGTQGLREMVELLPNSKLQIVSVCDPNKLSENYIDWSPYGIRDSIRKLLGDSSWGSSFKGIMGGRDIGKDLVDKYYGKTYGAGSGKGVSSYIDFRELLEKETGIDAVKIMTPDHLHATISIAAMKKGKQVVIHKPIANRMYEAKLAIETAKKTGVSTHLLAWSRIDGDQVAKKMIEDGAIGTLKEIHNWSNRPVWPQFTANPTEKVPIPDGFNWDLWLGPVPHRDYHPNYTNNVFRGWYDFGGGSIADMGHYSLWPLFLTLGINKPAISAEAYGTTTVAVTNQVPHQERENVAFPYSCSIKFKMPKQETLPAFDLYWYDGGIKPHTPPELEAEGGSLEREGMMIVGDKGTILASFHCMNPRLIPKEKMTAYLGGKAAPAEKMNRDENVWLDAFLKKEQSPGSFLYATPVTETILLGAVALRAGKRVEYDSANMKITNVSDANKYLVREYRQGWEL